MQSYILIASQQYVRQHIAAHVQGKRPFHSMDHTVQVVEKCQELSLHYKLSDTENEDLLLAAWFHDTGYANSDDDHEHASVKIATEFLSECAVSAEDLIVVSELILATRLPRLPKTLMEKIICDADLFHLAAENYMVISELLRKELELANGKEISDNKWRQQNISFFKSHHYFTDYARENWDVQKQKNLVRLL